MMKLPLPDEVKEALERLEDAGYEAFLVGGVRDLLLEREVNDWDITTSAPPARIKDIFSDCSQSCVGERFGTVTVFYRSVPLDITTYRKEGAYRDHRHPDKVHFTKNLFDDLKRRDFTVNAICYNPQKGFRDFFCGKRDLKKKLIRAIGNADERFRQDAVRILRALRFASTLGFHLEEKTKAALHRNKELLRTVAPERILPEFRRMLCGKNILHVLTEYSDVIGVLIPEILPAIGFSQHSPFHQYDVWQHTAHAVAHGAAVPEVRLSLFFHDISKPDCLSIDSTGRGHFYSHPKKSAVIARDVMNRLKFPAKEIERVCLLVSYHDSHPSTRADVKRLLGAVGEELFGFLIPIMEADTRAHSKWAVKRRLQHVHNLQETASSILKNKECYSLKTLAVNGNDLEKIGLSGKQLGEALSYALQKVIGEEWKNEKELILSEIQKNNWEIAKNH